MASKVAKIALTILACTSLSLPPTAAEAGMRTGTWRNGMVAGPYGVGWYGSHGYIAPSQHARYGGYYPGSYGAGYGGLTAIPGMAVTIPATMAAMATPPHITEAMATIPDTIIASDALTPVRLLLRV